MSYAGEPDEKFHFCGFKGVHPDDLSRFVRELRAAHIHTEVIPVPGNPQKKYVLCDIGNDPDIVPLVQIYQRTCRGKANVMSVHLTEDEMNTIDKEIVRRRAAAKGQGREEGEGMNEAVRRALVELRGEIGLANAAPKLPLQLNEAEQKELSAFILDTHAAENFLRSESTIDASVSEIVDKSEQKA